MSGDNDSSAVPPTQFINMLGGNQGQGGWPNQGGQPVMNGWPGQIIVRPISGSFVEDLDVFTKMVAVSLFRILSVNSATVHKSTKVRPIKKEERPQNGMMNLGSIAPTIRPSP